MYANNTLFIVGAGASHELGMPLGTTLKNEISKVLKLHKVALPNGPYGGVDAVENKEFYQFLYGERSPEPSVLPISAEMSSRISLWKQVGQGIHFSSSIDNFLYNRGSNEELVRIGKFAISWTIAEQEKRLRERASRDPRVWLRVHVDHPSPENFKLAWTAHFSDQCFSLVEPDGVSEALGRVRFISFNYDRCIEEFIAVALKNLYNLRDIKISELLHGLRIEHPYGTLGDRKNFGERPESDKVPRILQTFTERASPEGGQNCMAEYISWADTIIFLGFGFIAQNMKLLNHPGKRSVRVLGTAKGLSAVARQAAEDNIVGGFQLAKDQVTLVDLTCSELLAEHAVALVAS